MPRGRHRKQRSASPRPPSTTGSPDTGTDLDKSQDTHSVKSVYFYKDGDKYGPPAKLFGLNSVRKYPNMDHVMDNLNPQMNKKLDYGVRAIATPSGKHKIDNVEDLEPDKTYIVSDKPKSKMKGLDGKPMTPEDFKFGPVSRETTPKLNSSGAANGDGDTKSLAGTVRSQSRRAYKANGTGATPRRHRRHSSVRGGGGTDDSVIKGPSRRRLTSPPPRPRPKSTASSRSNGTSKSNATTRNSDKSSHKGARGHSSDSERTSAKKSSRSPSANSGGSETSDEEPSKASDSDSDSGASTMSDRRKRHRARRHMAKLHPDGALCNQCCFCKALNEGKIKISLE